MTDKKLQKIDNLRRKHHVIFIDIHIDIHIDCVFWYMM